MLFLNILIFFYIINISFIISEDEHNCSILFNTNIDCRGNKQYYNSMICNCSECDSNLINENICYNRNNIQSIYGFPFVSEIDSEFQCNNNEKLTELDDKGNWLGFLMCANSNINLEGINLDISEDEQTYNFDLRQTTIRIYFLRDSDTENPELGESQNLPKTFNEDIIRYYYKSCKNYYENSCNILANLCVLAMYNKNNVFCKMITELNRIIAKPDQQKL